MNKDLYKKVKEIFDKQHAPGHDFQHPLRVVAFAKKIAKAEGYDILEVEITALLHDMGRTVQKEHKDHGPAGVPLATELLDTYTDFPPETKARILDAIEHHSDKATYNKLTNILQDADKLDGMGAIGVLRAADSKYNLVEYDQNSFGLGENTASDNPKTLYEQILFQMRWVDMLYTQTARDIAKKRYDYMKDFLVELQSEVEESK